MATKPTSKPLWTKTNPTVRSEPTGAKKETGWGINERPPREFMNWLFYNLGVEWLDYFEEVTDELAGFAEIFSAFVGGPATLNPYPATQAGFQQAIDDSTTGDKILVLASIALDAQVNVTRENMEIEFHPRVVISKDAGFSGTAKGIRLSNDGIKLRGGIFSGFSGAGEFAITVDAASDFCRIIDPRFAGNDEDVEMLSTKSVIQNPITE